MNSRRMAMIAALAVALTGGLAHAQTGRESRAMDRDPVGGQSFNHRWYMATSDLIQAERQKTQLNEQGFPQYNP